MSTRQDMTPRSKLQCLLCDANYAHLGKKSYWERSELLRQEMTQTRNLSLSDTRWLEFEIGFLSQHRYFSPAGKALYKAHKAQHIRMLRRKLSQLELVNDFYISDEEPIVSSPKAPPATQGDRILELNQLSTTRINKPKKAPRVSDTFHSSIKDSPVNLDLISWHETDLQAHRMLSFTAVLTGLSIAALLPLIQSDRVWLFPAVFTMVHFTCCGTLGLYGK